MLTENEPVRALSSALDAFGVGNFGVLPLAFTDPADYDRLEQGDRLRITGLELLADHRRLTVKNLSRNTEFAVTHGLSERQVKVLLAGGLTNWVRESPRPNRLDASSTK
jgi:aconitate hydratase